MARGFDGGDRARVGWLDNLAGGRGDVVEIVSALPPAVCAERIARRVDPPGTLFGGRGVIGQADATRAWVRKPSDGSNSFQPEIVIKLLGEGEGTRLRCESGASAAVRVFMRIWIVAAVGIGGLMLTAGVMGLMAGAAMRDAWLLLFVPPVLVGMGLLVPVIGRMGAAGEADELVEFVTRVVEGRRDQEGGAGGGAHPRRSLRSRVAPPWAEGRRSRTEGERARSTRSGRPLRGRSG